MQKEAHIFDFIIIHDAVEKAVKAEGLRAKKGHIDAIIGQRKGQVQRRSVATMQKNSSLDS